MMSLSFLARCRCAACALLLAGVPSVARAQDPAEEPKPLLERLKLGGFVDLYYVANENHPADHANWYPGFGQVAHRADEFAVNLAGLDLSLPPAPVGFRLIVAAGNELELLKAGEPVGETVGRDAFRNVYQASISYATGLGRGLLVEGGLYQGHIGFESPLPKDNWNYTESWPGNLTPSYHAGVKLVYPFTATLSGELHSCNGWQIVGDNNDRKSVGTKLAWTPPGGSLTFNTWYGPELPGDNHDTRTLLDLIGTLQAGQRLQLAAEGLWAEQERPATAGGGADEWTVFAGWARYALGPRTWVAARAERMDDEGGAFSGFAQQLDEVTLTFEVRPRPELALKLEGRVDRSDARVFANDSGGGREREERLLVVAAILTF